MSEPVIAQITKSQGRKSLYHFTRMRNLQAIARYNALFSSTTIHPYSTGERRSAPEAIQYADQDIMTINAHLKIPESMMDDSTTLQQFRLCLDRHVFFWPTLKDCQKMMDTYARREPDEAFAVLELDAYTLLQDHAANVKLSKYDSGSAPRFPKSCSYKKSPAMFLPLSQFQITINNTVPTKASEIKEVLVEGQVNPLFHYLKAVYIKDDTVLPAPWRKLARPWSSIQAI